MIVQEFVEVVITPYNRERLEKLGYKIKQYKEKIKIKTIDLSPGSGTKILVKCDYCGKVFYQAYRRYIEAKDKHCCVNCRKYKFAETNIEKYGTSCTLKYGPTREAARQTFQKKYGCDYPLQNNEIYLKSRETFEANYNGHRIKGVPTSQQQKYIVDLYGAVINKRVGIYFVDGLFEEDDIYFEYDGGGHNFSLRIEDITKEEYNKKEEKRREYLKSVGLSEFRIICLNDRLPQDNDLLKLKDIAFKKIKEEGYKHCIFNTEENDWVFIKE